MACAGLGFSLSFLFFMDQNITSAIVNNPQMKLKKGTATHLDLFVVALINIGLSLMGLPWMHGSLPHSPLHLRALADVEERVAQGHVHEVYVVFCCSAMMSDLKSSTTTTTHFLVPSIHHCSTVKFLSIPTPSPLYRITNVRETRLASLIAHILLLISVFVLLPWPLIEIPTSVLHGLFLYMAVTSLAGNEMFERMLLLITEQVGRNMLFIFYVL